MAAHAKTVLVTRSGINADALAWSAKPAQDSGLYTVDIRPLLKAEAISLGSFVVMDIAGLCVSTSSSKDGLLVLTISGGDAQVYKLQFVFSDTGGHIEVFQVSLPVGAGMNCVVPGSARGATGTRGATGATGPAGPAGRAGLLDGANIKLLPNGLATGDELLVYRPGAGFYFVPASMLDPEAVIFAEQDAVYGGVKLRYTAAPDPDVVFDDVGVVFGNALTSFTTPPNVAPVIFDTQPIVVGGQATSFTAAPVTAPVIFDTQPVFANKQATAFNPSLGEIVFDGVTGVFGTQVLAYTGATTALVFVAQPVLADTQPAVFNGPPLASTVLFQTQPVVALGQSAVFA